MLYSYRCEQVTEDTEPLIYCSLIEHCYQTAQSGSGNVVYCRTHGVLGPYWVIDNHGVISLGHIAPDAVSLLLIIMELYL